MLRLEFGLKRNAIATQELLHGAKEVHQRTLEFQQVALVKRAIYITW